MTAIFVLFFITFFTFSESGLKNVRKKYYVSAMPLSHSVLQNPQR